MKYDLQSSRIHFLFGSGLSAPFLQTLGGIETTLAAIDAETEIEDSHRKIISAAIKKLYFDRCIQGNQEVVFKKGACENVFDSYRQWLLGLNQILLNRKNTLLNRQINLFTTNVDVFPEVALEDLGLEYNDGFYGALNPTFGLSNFGKSIFKTSQQYALAAEVPTFNVYKLHGSVSWGQGPEREGIGFDGTLRALKEISDLKVDPKKMIDASNGSSGLKDANSLVALAKRVGDSAEAVRFLTAFDKLLMVNPTKEKFQTTILNHTYYDLLRIYANELERENSLLYVAGFSFADEHIAEITMRAARSNPTLKVAIFAYDESAEAAIRVNLKLGDGHKNPNVGFVRRKPQLDDAGASVLVGGIAQEIPHNLSTIARNFFGKVANETGDQRG